MDVNNMNRNSLSTLLLSLSSIALAAPRPPRPTEGFVPSQRSPTPSGTTSVSSRPQSAGMHSRRQPRSMPPGMMVLPQNIRPNNQSPSVSSGGGIRKRTAVDAFRGQSGRFGRRGSLPAVGQEGLKRARTWGGEASRRLAPPIPSLPPPAAWQAQQNPHLPQPQTSPPVSWRHHQLPLLPIPGASSSTWHQQNQQQQMPPLHKLPQHHPQYQSQLQLPQVLPPPSWRHSPQQQINLVQQNQSHISQEPVPQHTSAWQQPYVPGPLSAPVPDWNAAQQQTLEQWQQQLVLPLPQQRPRSVPVTYSPPHDPVTAFATTMAAMVTLPSAPIVPSMPTMAQINEMASGSSARSA